MYKHLGSFLAITFFSLLAFGADKPPGAAIASAHPLATDAGFEVLAQGGNAFDAAIAVTATLAVVEPYSSGIGGGGFYLLHRSEDQKTIMLDAREKAPGAAKADMYLDTDGHVIPGASIDGPLAAGIPGIPAALVHLAKNYGALPLKKSMGRAIALARSGFPVDEHYRRMAGFRLKALNRDPNAASIFLHNQAVPALGHNVVQRDLAVTLKAIARKGRSGFYEGRVAQALVDGANAGGGIWSLDDLKNYQVLEREPITGQYHGIRITAASPPSSGGIALVTMLNILQNYPLDALSTVQRKHLIVEAMRRAYRDRAEFLGDPDFVSIPVERLTHPMYAQGLRAGIHGSRATPSENLPGPVSDTPKGIDTTHFSIIDMDGNRVAATLSINYPFGACYVAARTGVLLNDEMDDFVAKPGVPNAYGLIGADANAIKAGKRPLSSMTPTFLEGPKGIAILGTPGGSRIISMVLLGILSYAEGQKPQQWVSMPRFHHQYMPDVIQFETKAMSKSEIAQLRAYGHQLKDVGDGYGNMQAILWDTKANKLFAASDPRGLGKAQVIKH